MSHHSCAGGHYSAAGTATVQPCIQAETHDTHETSLLDNAALGVLTLDVVVTHPISYALLQLCFHPSLHLLNLP